MIRAIHGEDHDRVHLADHLRGLAHHCHAPLGGQLLTALLDSGGHIALGAVRPGVSDASPKRRSVLGLVRVVEDSGEGDGVGGVETQDANAQRIVHSSSSLASAYSLVPADSSVAAPP